MAQGQPRGIAALHAFLAICHGCLELPSFPEVEGIMLKLKKILNDLVEYAYADDPRLPRYKRFYVEYLKEKLKTKNGDYRPDTHHIRVFTKGRSDAQVMKTSIHELSHHVDFIQRNESRHDADFYAIYQRLLYTALDMGIFDKWEYLSCMRDSSDDNKVKKMLRDYRPKNIGYKKDIKRIIVKHAFEIRDDLKARGYTYNSFTKTWEKEVEEGNLQGEECVLQGLGAEYEYTDASRVTF